MQRRNPFKEENPTDACMPIEPSHSSRKEEEEEEEEVKK
jgi:hypothetical protein